MNGLYPIVNSVFVVIVQQQTQYTFCKTPSTYRLNRCLFVLLTAYDWINRDMMFKVLDIRLKSPILVNILRVFYTGTSAVIKDSKIFFKPLQDAGKEALNPLYYLMFIWTLF